MSLCFTLSSSVTLTRHKIKMAQYTFCFSGVPAPNRPEGTEERQREEQAQCWTAELEHHHV